MPPSRTTSKAAAPSLSIVERYSSPEDAAAALMTLLANFATRARIPDIARKVGMLEVPLNASTQRGTSGNAQNLVVAVFDLDDTLLEASSGLPIPAMVALAHAVHNRGGEVHIVTARLEDPEARAETEAQIRGLGLPFATGARLTLTPARHRTDLAKVSKFKAATRLKIARALGVPVLLTLGDAWSDAVCMDNEETLDELDEACGGSDTICLVRLGGEGTGTFYGLKLNERRRDYEDE